jgi:hypothetical protein
MHVKGLFIKCFIKVRTLYRLPRIRRLHHVSNLAQHIGEHPNPLFHVLRNSVLLSTPNIVKGKIFDQFIQTVSTAQL